MEELEGNLIYKYEVGQPFGFCILHVYVFFFFPFSNIKKKLTQYIFGSSKTNKTIHIISTYNINNIKLFVPFYFVILFLKNIDN